MPSGRCCVRVIGQRDGGVAHGGFMELPRNTAMPARVPQLDVSGAVVESKTIGQDIRFTNVPPQMQDQTRTFIASIDSSLQ